MVLSAAATYALMTSQWPLFLLCLAAVLVTTYNFIHYFNSINRKLSFFFEAIRNEDSTLHFPENVTSESTKSLNKSLNKLNQVISTIKIRNENREKFFIEFMKHATTGLLAVDEKGYVEIANDAALKLFGTGILVHLDRLKQVDPEAYDAIMSLHPHQSKTIKLFANGEIRFVMIKMVKLKFGEKGYRIYSLSDIKAELDEKEMDTWQKLIRILTHEIMNSIAPISSISDTLQNYFKENKKISPKELSNIQHGLSVINERGKGLIHFVDNYRKLMKVPKPVFETIALDDWLPSIELLFSKRAQQENIAFTVRNEHSSGHFPGDKKLLTQAVINLLNNAADALSLSTDKRIELLVSGSEGGEMVMRFIDNGPGISADNIEQIFIPFYTTKDNGSGIGLSLSRQIVRLHKGQLTARSQPGKETIFEIRM